MIHPEAFRALLIHNRAKTRLRLPRQAHPTLIAARYTSRLKGSVVDEAQALVREIVVPELERFAANASRIATTDARESLGQTMDEVETAYAKKWSRARFAKVVNPIANSVEIFNAAQLNRTLRPVIAIDVVGAEPWLRDSIAEFVTENVALIKSIPTRLFDDLEQHLSRGIADGLRWEELATVVEDRFKVSDSRAELIARDQVGKFYGDLNRVRQVDLGIDTYIWRTMNDNRVREEHAIKEGEEYKWGAGEAPGEAVLCRCYAEPNLTALTGEE